MVEGCLGCEIMAAGHGDVDVFGATKETRWGRHRRQTGSEEDGGEGGLRWRIQETAR